MKTLNLRSLNWFFAVLSKTLNPRSLNWFFTVLLKTLNPRSLNWFFCTAVLLVSPSAAHAHARGTSFSYWELDSGKLRGRLLFPWVEAQQAFPQWRGQSIEAVLADPKEGEGVRAYFASKIHVEGRCRPAVWNGPGIVDASMEFRFATECEGGVDSIHFDLTFDAAPSHVHLVRYEQAGQMLTGVVTGASRDWVVESTDASPAPNSLWGFVVTGFEHIAGGPDHLLFLLALLFLAPSLWALAGLATGFTLAHSLSLAVATLGLLRPDGRSVEALIGFTVAFSGLELILYLAAHQDPARRFRRWVTAGYVGVGIAAVFLAAFGALRVSPPALAGVVLFTSCYLALSAQGGHWRWLLVFLFGFIHGFGFAGPLIELAPGREEIASALLGFNLGVEAGQIAFLALLWPLAMLAKRSRWPLVPAGLAAAAVLALGIQWFVLRAV